MLLLKFIIPSVRRKGDPPCSSSFCSGVLIPPCLCSWLVCCVGLFLLVMWLLWWVDVILVIVIVMSGCDCGAGAGGGDDDDDDVFM